jgi:transposase
MPPSKVELYAAIRRDARAGMSGRAIEKKYRVGRRTIVRALSSAWPEPPAKTSPNVGNNQSAVTSHEQKSPLQPPSAVRTHEQLRSELTIEARAPMSCDS